MYTACPSFMPGTKTCRQTEQEEPHKEQMYGFPYEQEQMMLKKACVPRSLKRHMIGERRFF